MRYGIVDPIAHTFELVKVQTFEDAMHRAALPERVDHSVLMRGIGIVVYKYGLFVPAALQSYFAFGHRLYAGFALLYGYDETGRTCDLELPDTLRPRWFDRPAQVEEAIARGEIGRPRIVAEGEIIWSWPEPAPAGMGALVEMPKGTKHA